MISYHLRRLSARRADARPARSGPAGDAEAPPAGIRIWLAEVTCLRPPSSPETTFSGVPLPAKMATIASFIAVPTVLPYAVSSQSWT